MTETMQHVTPEEKVVDCYLYKSMEVPLTTGGAVRVHPSCMEFYLSKTATSGASACGGCTGGKGCC
ncbi:MAG: hypothetical protein ACXAB7_12035 [Candidatus Kariarchaeaceae archaeon]|jgi:hypothetical protein